MRNLPGLARFLPVAALFHAQTLSTASLARDAEVARTTVDGYLDVLEDARLAFRLPACAAKLRVCDRRHPKLYWIDAGMVRGVRRQLGPLTSEERRPLFEGWVANVLHSHDDYDGLFDEWCCWAPVDATRTEVDLLLCRGREWIAIEAKSAPRIGADHLRGLRAVQGLRGLVRRILVHPGDRPRRTEDGIEIWPVGTLLRALMAASLWP